MAWLPRPIVLASAGLAVLIVGALAAYLVATQRSAQDEIYRGFAERTTLAAELTSGALRSNEKSTKAFVRHTFGGPARTVQRAVEADVQADPQVMVLVLDARGEVLGAFPRALRREPDLLDRHPNLRPALHGTPTLGDMMESKSGLVMLNALPVDTPHGRRIWAGSFPVDLVDTFARTYLSSALGVDGGRAFLIDGNGRLLSSTGNEPPGGQIPDRSLRAAIRARRSGALGGSYFVSAPVPATSWTVVFSAPKHALLAPVRSTRRAAWQLFGILAAAILCLVALGTTALNRSSRLAHERLHDALTGLPNRALFLATTEQALASLQRRGGHLAALFIDLDRFKPINDVHGHAVGDALLVAVAERLKASIRSGDTVSRFGGDEFIVLCPALEHEDEALQIANRIQDALGRPFRIGAADLAVGCSIGIAMHSVLLEQMDAATLIHNADLAMYHAKQAGRSRVESFDPRLTAAAPAERPLSEAG